MGTPGFKWRRLRKDEPLLITKTSKSLDDKPASYGIGIVTNIPVIKWETLALGKSPIGLPLAFPGDESGKKIRFIYVKDEPRYAVAAQLENGWTVVNTHLSFVPIVNLIQLLRIKRWLSKMPGKHILLGDLNLPFNIPVKFSRWKSLNQVASYPTWQPKIQFDYILSESAAQNSVKPISIKSEISDHLPVTIEIN